MTAKYKSVFNSAVFLSLLIGLVYGCTGPSQTMKRADDFYEAGITYSDTVVDLLNVTIDRVISDDSDILIRQRKYLPEDELENALNEHDKALVPLVKTIGSFRDSTRKLKSYFKVLQEAGYSDIEEQAAPAVDELVESINSANKTIKKNENIVFNDEEKEFITSLSELAVKNIKAGTIHNSIKRSAPIICEQLLLHEKLLDRIRDILEDSYKIEIDKLHKKIREDYVSKEEELSGDWKTERKNWVTSQFFLESLENAITASEVMREKWEAYLSGSGDAESIALLLADVNEFLAAARGLKDI